VGRSEAEKYIHPVLTNRMNIKAETNNAVGRSYTVIAAQVYPQLGPTALVALQFGNVDQSMS